MRNDERLRTIYEVMAPYIVRNEHNWRDYLAFASQFHKHSFDNILLVYAQDEDVSILATRKQWAAIGRNLIPRAKGVAVCVYRNAKLTLDYLFDVSQTMVTLCTQKYDMGDKTLYNLVTEAFPIVLFVKKLEDNSRRVMEITECEILEDGTRQLHTLYRYHVSETSIEDGKVKVHGEFQKVSSISASLQKRLLENGMPPRLLERIAGGGVKPDTGKEETA